MTIIKTIKEIKLKHWMLSNRYKAIAQRFKREGNISMYKYNLAKAVAHKSWSL